MMWRKMMAVVFAMGIMIPVLAVSVPLGEGFEGGIIPADWTVIDNDGDGYQWTAHDDSVYAHTGTWSARIRWNADGCDDWLITPRLVVAAGDTFKFWARSGSATLLEDFNVLLSRTGPVISDFTDTLGQVTGVPSTYTEYRYGLDAFSGDTIYLAIQSVSVDQLYLHVDDVEVGEPSPVVYVWDFEADDGEFIADPVTGWEWGAPTGGPGGAHSGTKLWGTRLDIDYAASANWKLKSPQISLMGYTQAVLEFWHWYDIERRFDGGNVKISTDGGTVWTLITPEEGYDAIATNTNAGIPGEWCYTGRVRVWKPARFNLNTYIDSTIILKWHFGSDGCAQYPGWYIDDVSVYEPTGTIAGTVSDLPGIGIAGAVVRIHETGQLDTIDVDGTYLIDSVLVSVGGGTYTVTASAFGYIDSTVHGVSVIENDTTIVNFSLKWPEISVAPDSFVFYVPVNDSLDTLMIISSTGTGPLYFNISIDFGSKVKMASMETGMREVIQQNVGSRSIDLDMRSVQSRISPKKRQNASGSQSSTHIYVRGDTVISEGFEGTFPPTGWTKIDGPSRPGTESAHWRQSDAGSYNYTGSHGALCPWGFNLNEWLITPELPGGPFGINFWWQSSWHWHVDPNDRGDLFVKISTDGGTNWDTLWTFGDSAMVVNSGGVWPWANWTWYNATLSFPAEKAGALVAFVAVANNNANIAIDDVTIVSLAPLWLTVEPTSGSVDPRADRALNVQMNTTGLVPDSTYMANIVIGNNSAVSPVLVHVTLHTLPVAVEEQPTAPIFALYQNYPNPGTRTMTIKYAIPTETEVTLQIYDIAGRLVNTLVDLTQKSGYYEVRWDGTDSRGRKLPAGVYFYRLEADGKRATRKLILVK